MNAPADADAARIARGRLLCAGGCAVECDARGVRWWAEGERIPDGAAFPLAPTRPAPALPLPADWTL